MACTEIGFMVKEWKLLIAKDEVEELIEQLLDHASILDNKDYYNEAILISSDFCGSMKSYKKNLITYDVYQVEQSKIKNRLLAFLDQLPEDFGKQDELQKPQIWKQKLQLVEVYIAKELSAFNFDQKESLCLQIAHIAKTDPDKVVVIGIREGSVKIKILMPAEAAILLNKKFKSGNNSKFFSDSKIHNIKILMSSLPMVLIYYYAVIKLLFNRKYYYIFGGIILITLLAVYSIYFSGYSKRNSNKNLQQNLELQTTGQKLNEYLDLIYKEIDHSTTLNNQISGEIEKMKTDYADQVIDGDYTSFIKAIKELEKKYMRVDSLALKLDDTFIKFENQSTNVANNAPDKPENIASKKLIYNGLKTAREKINSIKANVTANKGATRLMLILVLSLTDDKSPKTREVVIAVNELLQLIPEEQKESGKS